MSRRRLTAAIAALCATGTLIGLSAAGVGARSRAGKADSGTAYVSTNRTAGGFSYASATNTDKLLGESAVTSKYTLTHQAGTTFKLSSKHTVLWSKTGSLEGTLSATVTVAGTAETFKNGKLDLTKGTGSLKGHSFTGTFTGSGNATNNQFVIHYKGTYK